MGVMDFVAAQVGSLLDFGRIASTRVLDQARSVVVRLVGSEDPDGDEARDGCELWGHAPLSYRPQAGTEALFVRWGDDRVIVATKDRRYQVELAEGEVVLAALGQTGAAQALVRLRPDGTIVVRGTNVTVGDDAANPKPIANGDAFHVFANAFLNATVLPNDGGQAIQIAVAAALTTAGYAAGVPPASVTVSDLKSSKHTVEL